jgi:hypothetical protein
VPIRTPGPPRALYERVRARRGAQIALVATARKLSALFWHPLTREERLRAPLAHAPQAARARAQDRGRLAPRALLGPTRSRDQEGPRPGDGVRRADGDGLPQARRRLQAQAAEKRCGRDTGARIFKSSSWRRDNKRGRDQPQNLRFSSSSPAPTTTLPQRSNIVQTLDFHPSASPTASRASSLDW